LAAGVTLATQALALNTPISGAITGPGQQQLYTFTLPTATRLSFDSQTNAPSLRWSLNGPTGPLLNNTAFNSAGWFIFDAPPGSLTLTVSGTGDSTGGYRFQILDLAAGNPISLDATVVLLTPVVLLTAQTLRVRPRPHVYACTHLANSASLLLPIANLTNLLAFAASGLAFTRFAGLMTLPWLVAIAAFCSPLATFWYFAFHAS